MPAAAEGNVAATDADVSSLNHITKDRGGFIAGKVTIVSRNTESGDCHVLFDGWDVLELDGDVAHVLLWFAVVAFDVIKMPHALPSVYRENCFSVDFEENPMFTESEMVSETRLRAR